MRIESLIFLLQGELKSAPSITSITSITSNPANVKRGSLFIAKEKSAIPQALHNGAYAIVYEGWAQVSDMEVAWIKVPSLIESLKKLFRFLLVERAVNLIKLDTIAFDFAKVSLENPLVQFCSADIFEDFEFFIHKEPKHLVFKDEACHFDLETTSLPNNPIKMVQPYLFESSFIFDGRYYQRIPIAPLFVKELATLMNLSTLTLSSLNFRPAHLIPYFVDKNFEVIDFGKSERVLIHEPSPKLASKVVTYLRSKASSHLILPLSFTKQEGFIHIRSVEELKKILYNSSFHYALIIGEELPLQEIVRTKRQPTLF